MKLEIAFIGSGNVAWHLSQAMDKAGHTIAQIIGKNEVNAKKLASKFGAHFSDDISLLYGNVDVCIIAVPDDAIVDVVRSLPPLKAGLVHTCGPKSMDLLASKSAQFGIFYPLQTFSKDREVNMLEVPIMLESSGNELYEKLFTLADSISNRVLDVNGDDRLKYHLAAVFANNFTNHLFYKANQYLRDAGLDFSVLKPLIQETSSKLKNLSPFDAQTGPAKRGDRETINRHLQMLAESGDLQDLYEILSRGISEQKRID